MKGKGDRDCVAGEPRRSTVSLRDGMRRVGGRARSCHDARWCRELHAIIVDGRVVECQFEIDFGNYIQVAARGCRALELVGARRCSPPRRRDTLTRCESSRWPTLTCVMTRSWFRMATCSSMPATCAGAVSCPSCGPPRTGSHTCRPARCWFRLTAAWFTTGPASPALGHIGGDAREAAAIDRDRRPAGHGGGDGHAGSGSRRAGRQLGAIRSAGDRFVLPWIRISSASATAPTRPGRPAGRRL